MARQGLMDDTGFDFFDASDCSHYESCVEGEYNRGFEAAIDMIREEYVECGYVADYLEMRLKENK